MQIRWGVIVACLGAVAGCTYKAATSASASAPEPRVPREREDTTARTDVGCVEVGVERRADRELSAVVRYAVENHCDRPITVDLAWASVLGRTADGVEMALVPDPTMAPSAPTSATIVPSGVHETTVAYQAPATIGQLCVDVASIAPANSESATVWRCFGNVVSVTMR